jgi:hypothetical protein
MHASQEIQFNHRNPMLPLTGNLVFWFPLNEGANSACSFSRGDVYTLTITAYSLDGSTFTTAVGVKCS